MSAPFTPFKVEAVTEDNTRGCMGCYPEGEPNPQRPLIQVVLGYGSLLLCPPCARRMAATFALETALEASQ